MNERLKEIEVTAAKGKGKLPPKMTKAELYYYKAMCGVYAQFNAKKINKEDAKKQKQAVLSDYKEFALWEQIFLDHIEINNALEKLIEPVGVIDKLSKQELIDRFKEFQCVLSGFFGGSYEN